MKNRPVPSAKLSSVLGQLLPVAGFSLAIAAIGILHVAAHVMVVESGYRLSSIERENQRLSESNDRLKLELATIKRPAHLERIAIDELKMGPPRPGSIVSLKADPSPRSPRLEAAPIAWAERGP